MRVSPASKPKLGMGVSLPFSLMRRAWGRQTTRLHDGIIIPMSENPDMGHPSFWGGRNWGTGADGFFIPRSPNARDLGRPIIFGCGTGVWGLTASSFPGPQMRGTWDTQSFLD